MTTIEKQQKVANEFLNEERDRWSRIDVLPPPSINAGDFFRVAVSTPRWVPASSRLPRGFSAWFLPHIPPGLTDSPQADTVRPTSMKNFTEHSNKMDKSDDIFKDTDIMAEGFFKFPSFFIWIR
ncbi:MAG: hypothetical protein ACI4NO_06385 [Oxalobacter sp.]